MTRQGFERIFYLDNGIEDQDMEERSRMYKEICNEVERKRMDNDEEVEEDMCIINLRIFIF